MGKLEKTLESITVRMIARQQSMETQTSESYREQCTDAWTAMHAALDDVKPKERPDAYKSEVERQETRFKEETGEAPGIVRLIGIHWLIKLVQAEKRAGIDVTKVTPWAWREFVVFLEQESKDADTYLTAPYGWKEEPTAANSGARPSDEKSEESAKEEALELLEEVSKGELSTRDVMEAKQAILDKYLPNRPVRRAKVILTAEAREAATKAKNAKKGVNLVVRQISKGLESTGAIRRAAFVALAEKKALGTTTVIGILQGMDAAGTLTLTDIQKIDTFMSGIVVRLNEEAGADEEPSTAPAPRKAAAKKPAPVAVDDEDDADDDEEPEAPAPRKGKRTAAAA